jgi:hypothetical protein
MARNKKVTEQETIEEATAVEATAIEATAVEATTEERLLQEAIHSIQQLQELVSSDDASETLKILITVYLSLQDALGDDSPSTQAALENLATYQSTKVKASKAKQPPKEKVFNEIRELRKAINAEIITDEDGQVFSDMHTAIHELGEDTRISTELKSAIVTFETIAGNQNLPQTVIDYAFNSLAAFGGRRPVSGGDRKPMEFQPPYEIEFNGEMYDSLSAALRAAGFNKDTLDDNQRPMMWNRAWTKAMGQIRKNGKATITNTEAEETADEELVFTRHFIDVDQDQEEAEEVE